MRCLLVICCLVLALRIAAAAPPAGSPADRAVPASTLPEKPPPPDLPPPADGGPNRFIYSTDEAIAYFRKILSDYPADASANRYLGEFLERKAREVGDDSLFKPAE